MSLGSTCTPWAYVASNIPTANNAENRAKKLILGEIIKNGPSVNWLVKKMAYMYICPKYFE